jgi:hypothetical protein
MYWVVAGLFVLGIACGATLRLMAFVVVLIGAAIIAAVAGVLQGAAAAALNTLFAVVTLQVGYAAGFVLRAAIRARQARSIQRAPRERPVSAPFSEKRR